MMPTQHESNPQIIKTNHTYVIRLMIICEYESRYWVCIFVSFSLPILDGKVMPKKQRT